MERLQALDPSDYKWLSPTDECWHYGEYTAEGGYQASDTNRWIANLKKKPTAPANQLYWKQQAYLYWGRKLRELMPPERTQGVVTFIPIPGSKPRGHENFDERMLEVLKRMANGNHGVDIRPVLIQTHERDSQHEGGGRLTPTQLLQTMAIDPAQTGTPLKSDVIIVDDVITMGASFSAAKRLLLGLPGVQRVRGVFLAKTVWPNPFSAL